MLKGTGQKQISLCKVVMPWALVVHGDFINDSGKEYIEEFNFQGARLKQDSFRGLIGG